MKVAQIVRENACMPNYVEQTALVPLRGVHGNTCGLLVRFQSIRRKEVGEPLRFRFSYIGGSPGNVKTV